MRTKISSKTLEELEQEIVDKEQGVFAGNKDRPLTPQMKKTIANDIRQKQREFERQLDNDE